MFPINQPIQAVFTEKVVGEALKAMIDAEIRVIKLRNGKVIHGWIWEIYRSIQSPSVRIRCSDASGYVYHYNSLDIEDITK